jgi:1,2-diacylglycerol 3-alpha-glucosyltransferase
MKIAMFTNTYLPHVGGVARSVKTLEDRCRELGHEVLVVAPEFAEDVADESDSVLRVPAICNFNGSDFSVRLPIPNIIHSAIEEFDPDLIHSHHPFLLGDAALREAWKHRIPIVFTHHTLYERYTHYVPLDSPALKRVAIQLSTEYCNLCDTVIAPSDSIRRLLLDRGVTAAIEVTPTGIDTTAFASGDGTMFRKQHGIPLESRVIGHVGRLAKEKNLIYLAEAVRLRLSSDPNSAFLLVGEGNALEQIQEVVGEGELGRRMFAVGRQSGQGLQDAYAAMDLFVFASQTETQGMVLAEAMAAGKPVVAIDGPGVREIMRDRINGLMLSGEASPEEFAEAIGKILDHPGVAESYGSAAMDTARDYDRNRTAEEVIAIYQSLLDRYEHMEPDRSAWDRLLSVVEIEWDLIAAKFSAAAAAVIETEATETCLE